MPHPPQRGDGRELREDDVQHAGAAVEVEGDGGPAGLGQDLSQLLVDALGGKLGQVRRGRGERAPDGGLDLQPELPGEAERAQDPQVVLREAVGRRPDRAQPAGVQIGQAGVRIAQLPGGGLPGQGVEGEVAAGEVLLERVRELDHGVAAGGLHVAAEGGDLVEHVVLAEDADGAVLYADGDGAAEEAAHLLRAGGRGEVPVHGGQAEHGVADGAADGPGVEAGLLEAGRDLEHRRRGVQVHGAGQGRGGRATGGRAALCAAAARRLSMAASSSASPALPARRKRSSWS